MIKRILTQKNPGLSGSCNAVSILCSYCQAASTFRHGKHCHSPVATVVTPISQQLIDAKKITPNLIQALEPTYGYSNATMGDMEEGVLTASRSKSSHLG